jgi:hypothetical protein
MCFFLEKKVPELVCNNLSDGKMKIIKISELKILFGSGQQKIQSWPMVEGYSYKMF